jgi:hypothetical protein
LLPLDVMPTQRSIFDEDPSIDGPDYVALVIEWDELADDLERQLRADEASLIAEPKKAQKRTWRNVAIGAAGALGVLGTVLLARRLHH